MRRIVLLLAAATLVLAGCSDDDAASDAGAGGDGAGDDQASPEPRFCDVYLDYLGDPTDENLDAVESVADDDEMSGLIEIARSDAEIGRVLAATEDLDALARQRCQPEWTAGAQGAGSTEAAASAFFDALVAGDRIGARNVASANAIAVFEPWGPIEADPDAGTPAIGEVGERTFSLVLGPASIAACEVEVGVVITCQVAT